MNKTVLKVGMRFFVEDDINVLSVVSFDEKSMFVYSELLKRNWEKPFRVIQFHEMVGSDEITILN